MSLKPEPPRNTITLPREYSSTETLFQIISKYKSLRLTALQTDPAAFTSTYAREIQFSDEAWKGRVLNPLARIFIFLDCTSNIQAEDLDLSGESGSSDVEVLMKYPWLGQLTLLGPVVYPDGNSRPWELFNGIDFKAAAEEAELIRPGERVVYILVGMYVLAQARGGGAGGGLLEKALAVVAKEARDKSLDATLVVLVACSNTGAKRLYERVGFVAREQTVDIEGDEHWALYLNSSL
ncbi:hypothetical protein BDV18DRAFT_158261 [Aspergillus unguis]